VTPNLAKYNLLQNRMIQFLVAENSKDVNNFPTPAAFRQNYLAEFEGISGDSQWRFLWESIS
jgi:hypothetical protein